MKQFSIKETIANPLEDSLLKNLESAADEKDDLSADEIAALPEIKFRRAEYSGTNAEKTGYSNYSYWRSTFRMFCKNRLAVSLLAVIIVMLVFAQCSSIARSA